MWSKQTKILKFKNTSLLEAMEKNGMWYNEIPRKESIKLPCLTLDQHFKLDIILE